MANESQEKILESLTIDDYKNIELPMNDFFDDSFSDSDEEDEHKKKRYRFRHGCYEKYSINYFCETILEIKSKEAKFIDKININELTVYNKSLPWFDENLFYTLLDFCKNEKNNIIFAPDYIIKNISGDKLLNGIEKHKENIQYYTNLIDIKKTYDLIGDISINYLSENRKTIQTLKYINIINLFHKIQKNKQINPEKKQKFEDKFGFAIENEKILIINTEGNYLNNLKDSKIFKEDIKEKIKENNDKEILLNNKLTPSQQILNDIQNSGINFIIVYVPRPNIKIKTIYSFLDNFESVKSQIEDMKEQITKIKKERAALGNLREEILKLKNENENLKEEINKVGLKIDKLEHNK